MIASVLTNKKYPLFPDLAGLKCVHWFVFPSFHPVDFCLQPPFWTSSPLFIKSGSKWQSGLNQGIFDVLPVPGNRSYWGTYDPIFSDNVYFRIESGITCFAGRKTGLNIPFWLADLLFHGLEYPETEKRLFRGWWFLGESFWEWGSLRAMVFLSRYIRNSLLLHQDFSKGFCPPSQVFPHTV